MEERSGSKPTVEKRGKSNDFKCELCKFSCSKSITLQRHQKDMHSSVKRPFKCSYCDFTATTCEKLTVHRKVHGILGSKNFKCSKCSAQFTSGDNLKNHFNKHAGRKPHECKLCHFKSSYRPVLAAHMLKHDPNKQLRCSQCKYATHCKVKLKRHTVVHHSQAPFIQCTESGCKYKTKDKNYMTIHINGVHKKDVHYRCKLCAKGFYAKGSFENHFRTHTGERPFKCNQCDFSSGNRSSLIVHQKAHYATHTVQCPTCHKVLRGKSSLQSHQKVHSESRQFVCTLCFFWGKTEPRLQRHLKSKHNAELTPDGVRTLPPPKSKKEPRRVPYIRVRIRRRAPKIIKTNECQFCDFRTKNLSSYNSHVRRHTGEKPFKCNQCDYASVQRANLHRHQLLVHKKADLPMLSCTYCKFQTKSKESLRQHERRHFSATQKSYKCSQCSFSSGNKANLEVHLRTHTGERPFPCSFCPYKATTKFCLESHLASHSGEKPFKCPICDFRAATKSTVWNHKLNRHESGAKVKKTFDCTFKGCVRSYKVAAKLRDHVRSKHNNETRFTCLLCSKAFFHNYHLTCHLRTHTGEKPHKCDVCSYTAASSSAVIDHKKRVHFLSREFRCSECDRTYKSQAPFNRHLEFHSLDRKHPCPLCAYRAHTKDILKAHWERCQRRQKSADYKNCTNKHGNKSVDVFSKQTEKLLFVKFGCKPCTVRVERLEMTK